MVFIGGINLTQHKPKLKLGGFISINVDVEKNEFCTAMRKADTICKQCYAYYMSTRCPRLKRALLHNYDALSEHILTVEQIETIGNYVLKHAVGLRFNSIGELINDKHALNLLLISSYIRAQSPRFPITIWSKRVALIQKHFIRGECMNIIYSNPIIDDIQNIPPYGFDGIFNVITYDYAKRTGEKPNCGGKCKECMLCYSPRHKNTTFAVVELIKRDQNSIKRGKLEEL